MGEEKRKVEMEVKMTLYKNRQNFSNLHFQNLISK